MKRLSFLLSFIGIVTISSAQGGLDTTTVSNIVNQGATKIVSAINGQSKQIADSVKAAFKVPPVAATKVEQKSFWTYLISFLPVMLFLLIGMTVMTKLSRDNISLSYFLVDKEKQVAIQKEETKAEVANARATEALAKAAAANPQVAQNLAAPNPNPPAPADDPQEPGEPASQSTSRLIAFITGITSLGLAACVTTFYFYRWSLGEHDVTLGNLTTVLYGLGLGILPYGFSKIASAINP